MARNGNTAVATKDPADFYDGLSQVEKDLWDGIGIFGFTPEKGAAGLWFARKPGQAAKDAIGPADSIAALHSLVRSKMPAPAGEDKIFDDSDIEELADELGIGDEISDDLADPEMIELEDDGNGNPYLPGHAPKVIKALAHAIRNYDTIKLQRVDLSGREASAKKDLKLVLKKYERFLEVDEETGEKFYVVGKIRGKIKIKEEEVFLTDHVDTEDE